MHGCYAQASQNWQINRISRFGIGPNRPNNEGDKNMTKKRETQINVRFSDELIAALRQYQVNETVRRNKAVSLHSLIIEAIQDKLPHA